MLPGDLALGPVHLKVSDLERSVAWYSRVIGFTELGREGSVATLGVADRPLLVLHERPGARRLTRHSGLYHVAILFESRLELARVAQRIFETDTPIDGASDHGTHEAIYLPDPDGNGLELAADRPREAWPNLADITAIAPKPLDIGALFNLVSGREAEPLAGDGTRIGHLHLHVGDIDAATHFYHDVIGFDLKTQIDSAAFVSAGGYHHHLAFNIWQGRGAPPMPEDALGLMNWTIELPEAGDVATVRDRLDAAGAPIEDQDDGFETRDPSENRVRVISR